MVRAETARRHVHPLDRRLKLNTSARVLDLDANATTPLAEPVFEAMVPWLRDRHGNPSGTHRMAKEAREAIERARVSVATLVGGKPDEIVFTSGGTESVATALLSLDRLCGKGKMLTSAIEHSCVLRTGESITRGMKCLAVSPDGAVDLNQIDLSGAAFVSLMMANNETGVLQPVRDVAQKCRAAGLPIHTDAIQAVGKVPIEVGFVDVDMLSISAHKFHGPKGVGALWVREGLRFEALLRGGGQERGRRSGTENVASIVGMGVAAELAIQELDHDGWYRIRNLRDAFESILLDQLDGVVINGRRDSRLPNTTHISFEGCDAGGLLILLDDLGLACSAGSSCMSGKQKPSHVQLAMGIPVEQAKTSLRFCFSRYSRQNDAVEASRLVIRAVRKLRSVQGEGVGPVVIHSQG